MELLFIVLPMLIAIGIFFLLRGMFLWYWKIDKVVDLLEGIDAKLMVLKNELTNDADVVKDNEI